MTTAFKHLSALVLAAAVVVGAGIGFLAVSTLIEIARGGQ